MASSSSRDIYDETLAVFDRVGGRGEPLTTPEVAAALDANRRTVYKRLRTLVDRGDLETKTAGANARVWWRPTPAPAESGSGPESGVRPGAGDGDRPGADGLAVTGRQLQSVLDTIDALVFIKDVEGRYRLMNEACRERLGLASDADVDGLTDADLFSVEVAEQYRADDRRALDRGETIRIEEEVPWPGGTRTNLTLKSPLFDADGEPVGVCAVSTDITERTRRERELKRYEAIVEAIDDQAFVVDDDWSVAYANRTVLDGVGTTADEIEGRSITSLGEEYAASPGDVERFVRALERAFDPDAGGDDPIRVELALAADGIRSTFEYQLSPIVDDGEPRAVVITGRDVTERRRRERELQARSTAMEASIDGMAILDADGEYVFVNQAHAEVYGYEDADALLGETWRTCYDEDAVARLEEEIMPTLRADGSWRGELVGRRTDGTSFPQELSLTATDDGGIVCVVRDVTDRKADERELERRRERLAALDELNGVVRGITESVLDQSTREEIERVVCERLAASDSYRFAWICAVDPNTRSVEPRAEAGVDGYLDDIPLSVDPGEPTGRGPTGRAALSREMQVERDVLESDAFEPWHEYAREYGYRSSAAIPIVHEGTLYGVIGVYSARSDAFAAEEREVVGQLGEVVGHAIAAVDHRRALTSEEVVELEFILPHVQVLDFLDDGSGTVVFDRIVPVGDGSYIEYGVASDGMLPAVESLIDAESTPHSGPMNVIDSRDGKTRFEIRLEDPPVLSAVVSLGGYVEEVRVEDGQYQFRVHLPSGVDARPVIRAVTDTYPGAELVTRNQTTRPVPSTRQLGTLLDDRLTERQRAALEAGYFGGFFEWPRASSGEDVAASLGIGASTFHQHLRKAEKKLLDVVFEAT